MKLLRCLPVLAALLLAPLAHASDVDPIPEGPQPHQGKLKLKDHSVKETAKQTGKDFGHGMKAAGHEVKEDFKQGGREVRDTAKGLWRDLKGLKKSD